MTSDEQLGVGHYQQAAQKLLEFEAEAIAERGLGKPGAGTRTGNTADDTPSRWRKQ